MKKYQNQIKVSIVGAGPGDKDLITVKGLKAIQSANAILYDALANKELLIEAKKDCRLIYVGKRAGVHKYPQDKINALIVNCTIKYGNVVRLKGGDPFIFGRGHEELEYLRGEGIETEIIPGISSATALPLLQQVPLTRRGVSQSFWVITGTTTNRTLSNDIYAAIQTSATLVILMGIRKLQEICDIIIESGKGNIPIMIIQNGSLPQEKFVLGDARSIVHEARKKRIGSPGIIVIGDVVALHPEVCIEKTAALWRA